LGLDPETKDVVVENLLEPGTYIEMAKDIKKYQGRMSVIEKSQKLLTPKVKGPAKKFTFPNNLPKSTKNSD
jgi:hypothetical protein